VYIHHGMFDSSDSFFVNKEERCLPFILADRGFDVWLGNSRGNKHSKYHQTFSPVDLEFWSFSHEEVALYDLKANFELISSKNSSKDQIIMIGYNTGATAMLIGGTLDPNYFKEKVKLFIALAPVTSMENADLNFLQNIYANLEIDKFIRTMQIYEVFQENALEKLKGNDILLKFLNEMITKLNDASDNNDPKAMKTYMEMFPAGTSYKMFNHFIQNIRKKRFCPYDYGLFPNMELYKVPYTPDYKLENFPGIPVAVVIGKNDRRSTSKDANVLKEKMKGTVVNVFEVANMGHSSFLVGSKENWFDDALAVMVKYSHRYFEKEPVVLDEGKKDNNGNNIILENGIIPNENINIETEEKKADDAR